MTTDIMWKMQEYKMNNDARTKKAAVVMASHGEAGTTPAERALAEAAERRAKIAPQDNTAKEINGPKGLEPTRYGDWEKRGIASDF
jgi:hypothetical protein